MTEPGRIHLQEERGEHHRAVERHSTRVVADQHGAAAFGHVLDPKHPDVQIVAIEPAQSREKAREVALRDPEGIQAEAIEVQLESPNALFDLGIKRRCEKAGQAHRFSFRPAKRSLSLLKGPAAGQLERFWSMA